MCIIQASLALCLKFLEEVEEPESESGAGQLPRCREPAYTHELNATGGGGASLATDTGDKAWCSGPVHRKYTARKWTMYLR